MALEGKQLGRYRIMRLLGSGGMGDVYLAEDPRIGQQVAVKVLRAEQSPYPHAPGAQEAARLFQREARAIGQLDHPQILPLHDFGEAPLGEQPLVYLVMPYRPEGSLVRWVQQHYPDRLVPPSVVAPLLRQAAEALQHAHDHQIIHQDVKPSNFLIRERQEAPSSPEVFLADFGVARLATSTASVSQAIRGTPTYMAPEQCVGEAVPASDQYALAVMAYELLTGRPPFEGTSMRMMYQHVHTPPEPPTTRNPHLSKALDDVLLTALSKSPEARFRSMTAFAQAFQQAAERLGRAEAATIFSAQPVTWSTETLPTGVADGNALADLPTKITPSAEAAAPPLPEGRAEGSPPPADRGWVRASTEPAAAALPVKGDLDVSERPATRIIRGRAILGILVLLVLPLSGVGVFLASRPHELSATTTSSQPRLQGHLRPLLARLRCPLPARLRRPLRSLLVSLPSLLCPLP